VLIEGNHIHNPRYNQADQYFPPDKAYLNNTIYNLGTGHPFIIGEGVNQTDSDGRYTNAIIANVLWETHQLCGGIGQCYIMYLRMITPSESWYPNDNPFYSNESLVSFVPIARGGGFHQGQGLSVRISNVTVRNNTIHGGPDGRFSRGIRWHIGSGPYENIILENNVVYDTSVGNGLHDIRN